MERSWREAAVAKTLGPYRLGAVLGEGTMGVVYKATRSDGEVVALKVLKPALAEDETYRQRFRHETRAAQEVQHPHLVPVLDAGVADGRAYLAVAYVAGRSLAEQLQAEGPLAVIDVARIAAQLGAALDALHRRGLVHRDVKPANVMVAKDAGAALTDFGLAKGTGYTVLTRAGQVVGTMDYLAPELIRGGSATPATDIYALGCVLVECLTGAPPFGHRDLFEVGAAHLDEIPPDPSEARPDVSAAVSEVVLLALAKEPDARPATGTMYAHLLRAAAASASR